MNIKNYITPIPLIIKDTGTFVDANYIPINDIPLPLPCSILRFINICNLGLKISFDGVNDHLFMPSGTYYVFSPQKNNMFPASTAQVPKGTIFWAKTVNQPHVPFGSIVIAGYSSYRS